MSEEKPKKATSRKSATRTNINLLIVLLVILFLFGVAFVIYLYLDSQKKGEENRAAIETELNEPVEEKVTIDLSSYEAYTRIEAIIDNNEGLSLVGSVGQGEFNTGDIIAIISEDGEQATGSIRELRIGSEIVNSALIGSNVQIFLNDVTQGKTLLPDWYLVKVAPAPVVNEVIENPEESTESEEIYY